MDNAFIAAAVFPPHDNDKSTRLRIKESLEYLRRMQKCLTADDRATLAALAAGETPANLIDELWKKRSAFSARLKTIMQQCDKQWEEGDEYRISRWIKGNDVRVYIAYRDADFGKNLVSYFASGNQKVAPKTLELAKVIKDCPELRQLVSDIASEKQIGDWKTKE